jgi:hypothetical protein
MRYGVQLPNFGLGDEPDELVKMAVAEQAGWDAVFVWDALGVDVGEKNPAYVPGCDPWMSLPTSPRQPAGSRSERWALRRPGADRGNWHGKPSRWTGSRMAGSFCRWLLGGCRIWDFPCR